MLPERIGTYRIVEPIGRGGMGMVYRAWDEHLERPVAIKQVLAAALAGPEERERFWREARSAAQLVHPSIVRIYHMVQEEAQDYIVMEFVPGRTLARLLGDEGRLSAPRAARLFREIAEGLAAAHAEGIVHRDLKAENVMVTPKDEAKILDFGLAKQLGPTDVSLSAPGAVLGTPHTMSPEQARGHRVDERSDLFSLGAVLYQALTGAAPFRVEQPREALSRVCLHNPKPVSQVDPAIPAALSDLVVRLLEKDPANRPRSAADVAVELGRLDGSTDEPRFEDEKRTLTREDSGEETLLLPSDKRGERPLASTSAASSYGAAVPRFGSRRLAAVASAVAVFLAVVVAVVSMRSRVVETDPPAAPLAPAASIEVRPSVAVLGLDNLSGRPEDDWIATAATEVLVTQLEAGGELRGVSGAEVARARQELASDKLTDLTGEDLERLGRRLGTGWLVWGTYGDVAGRSSGLLRMDLRLRDAAGGVDLASAGATGTPRQLFALVERLAEDFRERLGLEPLTPAQAMAARTSLPAGTEALRLYSEGLYRLRRLEATAARDLLKEAVAAEPEHPLPYAALAEAWSVSGYEDRAREAAGEARSRAGSLPETLRRRLEAQCHEVAYEWDEAIHLYGILFATFPDDIDVGLELAEVQIEAGRLPEALVTLEALRRLPEPLKTDPRIDLLQARVSYRRGEAEKMRIHAEQAARRGQELEAPLVVAEARLRQTTALQLLGQGDRAMACLEEAKELFDAHDDRLGSAQALEAMAHSVLDRSDLEGARRLFERARALYREVGDPRRAAGVQGTLGSILVWHGRLEEAVEALEDALATFRDLGDKKEAAIVLNNLGFALFAQGEWEASIERYREALVLSEQLRDRKGVAFASTNIAEILYVRGELDQASKMHEEALAINREILDPVGIAYDTFRLGKILAARGDVFAARSKYEEALEAQDELSEVAAAAETRFELAVLELIEDDARRAESLSRQSEEILRNEGWSDLAALAGTVLVRARLARGRLAEAREAMAVVEAGAADSQDRRIRLAAAITAARLRAVSSREEAIAAVSDLDKVAAEATTAGFVEEALEARLAAGELAMAAGDATAATRLAALEAEARDRGYGQIARRAAKAQNP